MEYPSPFAVLVALEAIFRLVFAGTVHENPQTIDKKVLRICRQAQPSFCDGSEEERYFFDISTGRCTAFNYGKNCQNHQRSENNFETHQACLLSCGNVPPCPPADIATPVEGCMYKLVSEANSLYPYCPYPKLFCPKGELYCPSYNTKEEEIYIVTCEFLLDALYDLELDALTDVSEDFTLNKSHSRKRRNTNAIRKLLAERNKSAASLDEIYQKEYHKSQKKENSDEVSQLYDLRFFPERPGFTLQEESARQAVCEKLVTLPGVKLRCCTMLSVICPEYTEKKVDLCNSSPTPTKLAPPPGKPPPPRGENFFSNFLNNLQHVLGQFLDSKGKEKNG